MKDEYNKVTGYPDTPRYIVDSLTEEVNQSIAELRPKVVKAAIAEHAGKIDSFKWAQAKVKRAIANEIARWDPRQLLDQMEFTRARVQAVLDAGDDLLLQKNAGSDLEAIYNEAAISDDPVRLRAAAEVFRSVLFKMPQTVGDEGRKIANRLQFRAEDDLRQLKETEELKAAQEGENAAWQELLNVQEDLFRASRVLDGYDADFIFASNEFSQAVRRVRVLNDERVILEANDPDVTGVLFKGVKGE